MLSPLRLLLLFPLLSSLTISASLHPRKGNRNNASWSASRFRSLITFGDSYTDENRLLYFFLQKNTPPPPGTLLPESYLSPSGGRTWPRYVVQYAGEELDGNFVAGLELYNYAVGGAVCSNEITPKYGILLPVSIQRTRLKVLNSDSPHF
jgi:hypothetical protein